MRSALAAHFTSMAIMPHFAVGVADEILDPSALQGLVCGIVPAPTNWKSPIPCPPRNFIARGSYDSSVWGRSSGYFDCLDSRIRCRISERKVDSQETLGLGRGLAVKALRGAAYTEKPVSQVARSVGSLDRSMSSVER